VKKYFLAILFLLCSFPLWADAGSPLLWLFFGAGFFLAGQVLIIGLEFLYMLIVIRNVPRMILLLWVTLANIASTIVGIALMAVIVFLPLDFFSRVYLDGMAIIWLCGTFILSIVIEWVVLKKLVKHSSQQMPEHLFLKTTIANVISYVGFAGGFLLFFYLTRLGNR
jgi:hypothetical protein